jgi:hypothetical protein
MLRWLILMCNKKDNQKIIKNFNAKTIPELVLTED